MAGIFIFLRLLKKLCILSLTLLTFHIFFIFSSYGESLDRDDLQIEEDLDLEAETYILDSEALKIQLKESQKREKEERLSKKKAKHEAEEALEKTKAMSKYVGQEISYLDKKIRKLVSDRKALKENTLEANALYDQLVLKLDQKKHQYSNHKQKNREALKKNKKVNQSLSNMRKKITQLDQDIKDIKAEKRNTNIEFKKLSEVKKTVTQQLLKTQKKHRRVLKKDGQEVSKLKLKIKKMKTQVKREQKQISNIGEKEKNLKSEISELKKQVERVRKEKRKTSQDVRKYKIRLQSLIKIADLWRKKLQSL